MLCEPGKHLENELLIPYTYLTQVPSKNLRKRIAAAFNHWLQVPEDRMREVVDIMDIYHVSSLLVDDIQDGNTVRRGMPAAHCVYGVPWAMNTSMFVMTKVLERCCKFHPKGAEIFTEHTLELGRGQGKEIYWRDTFKCPTEDEYREMQEQKTSTMLLLAVRLMQLISENKTDYTQFGNTIGYYFQLRDDFCNIIQPEELEERPSDKVPIDDYYMDLTEGKFSLPIIHALKSPDLTKSAAVFNILKQRTKDITVKRYCVSLLEELGSLEYTRQKLLSLDRHLRDEVKRLGGNPIMIDVLDALLTWDTPSRKI